MHLTRNYLTAEPGWMQAVNKIDKKISKNER